MYFDKITKQWKRHPSCKCNREPCICRGLMPLDENGKEINYPIIRNIWPTIAPSVKK